MGLPFESITTPRWTANGIAAKSTKAIELWLSCKNWIRRMKMSERAIIATGEAVDASQARLDELVKDLVSDSVTQTLIMAAAVDLAYKAFEAGVMMERDTQSRNNGTR
jgi:hypothetical protein